MNMVGYQKSDALQLERLVTNPPAIAGLVDEARREHRETSLKKAGFSDAEITTISASAPDLNVLALADNPQRSLRDSLQVALDLHRDQDLPTVLRHNSLIMVVQQGDTLETLQARFTALEQASRQGNVVGAGVDERDNRQRNLVGASVDSVPLPLLRNDLPPDVQQSISALWEMMAERLGISGTMPTFKFDAEETTAYYRPGTNEITLSQNTLTNGGVWGEEITHSLYTAAHKKPPMTPNSLEHGAAVEFIGYLGRHYAASVATPQMKSDYFDPIQPEEPWHSTKVLTSEVARYNSSPLREAAESSFQASRDLQDKLSLIALELRTTLQAWLDTRLNNAEVTSKIAALANTVEQAGHIEQAALAKFEQLPLKYFPETCSEILRSEFRLLKTSLEILQLSFTSQPSKALRDVITTVPSIYQLCKDIPLTHQKLSSYYDLLGDLHETLKNDRAWHAVGYAAAELYIKDNPDWMTQMPTLVKMSPDQIYHQFVETPQLSKLFREAVATINLEDIAANNVKN